MSLPSFVAAPNAAPETNGAESPKDTILRLARQHGISHQAGPDDAWVDAVTRLSGDDVELDDISLLLLALRKAGVVSGEDGVQLLARYLRSYV